MTQTFIIWDLGATKCGVARVKITDHHFLCEKTIALDHKAHTCLDEMVDHIEAQLHLKHEHADRVLIAGAGTYDGHVLEHENPYPFRMDFARLAWERHWPLFKVVHDYVPVLCSTFTPYIFDPKYATTLLPGVRDPSGRHVVFGVGTGLGLKDGALLEAGQLFVGSNEMGHMGITFPPLTDADELKKHQAFMDFLIRKIGHPITFESVLSGVGLARVHEFCTGQALSPGQVSSLLHEKKAENTAALFAWYLGLFIGAVHLSFMPSGGLWMTGGVLKKNPMLTEHSELFKGMNAHPAYQQVRDAFPLGFIKSDELTYLGGAWYISSVV